MKKTALFAEIFTHMPIAVCILETKKKYVRTINNAFSNLTGYNEEDLKEDSISLEDLIYKKDLEKIAQRLEHLDTSQHLTEQLRISAKNKGWKEVEIAIKKIKARTLTLVCTFTNISVHKEEIRGLEEKINEEKQKAIATTRGIICTKLLLEKLYKLPSFFRGLWNCLDQDTLVQKTVHLICSQPGLHYESATILLQEGEHLQIKASNKSQPLQKFHIDKKHKFACVFRGEIQTDFESSGECALPIISPKGNEGVLQVIFNEQERALIQANEQIKKAHWELLQCVSQFLGVLLHSLRSITQGNSVFQSNMATLQEEITQKIKLNQEFSLVALTINHLPHALFNSLEIDWKEVRKNVFKAIEVCKPTQSKVFQVGEEIFFFLSTCGTVEKAGFEAEQILRKLKQHNFLLDSSTFSFSFGISSFNSQNSIINSQLLQQVSECLKEACYKKENAIVIWKDSPYPLPKRISTKLQ